MAMLVSLTSTALSRQWPPPVYARLAQQLRDSADLGSDETVLEVYEKLVSDLPLNPLLMEYIAALASDQHAILWFPVLLHRYAAENWRERSSKVRALISYLARSSTEWELPPEHESLLEDLGKSVRSLLVQAAEGAAESRLLLESLGRGSLLAQISAHPSWLASIEPYLPILGPPFTMLFGRATTEPPKNSPYEDTGAPTPAPPVLVAPSRSMRLLWLEWLLSTTQPLAFAFVKPQLDVVWAGDRVPTICYELCVTAFDVYAAKPAPYVAAFVVKALPLLLQQLAAGTPDVLDGVLARVFTTMDKEVAEAMDTHSPALRADFCSSCIEMGLCDPTVLHALHRSYTPPQRSAITSFDELSRAAWNMEEFANLAPPEQAQLAQEIVYAAQGALRGHFPLDRHALALLCGALYRTRHAADQLFLHASVRDFLQTVVEHADAASLLWEEDGGDGLVYSDLGAFLATADMLAHRYAVELPANTWTREYLMQTRFASVGQLSPDQSQLLGQWVRGLFSGSGSGIGDELLRPFRELAVVLPALLRQAIPAYRSAVIDRETLKSGLNYFVQPFLVVLMAPLVFRVLHHDLFEGLHQATTLEAALFYLSMVLHSANSEAYVAKAAILPTARKMKHDINLPAGDVSGAPKLAAAFRDMVRELAAQMEPAGGAVAAPVDSGAAVVAAAESSLAEAVKRVTLRLADWQARPQGVPALPCIVINQRAKPGIGAEKVREIVERAATGSPDTVLALLLADALWSGPGTPRLLDTEAGDSRLSQSAREVRAKFAAIAGECEDKHAQAVAELREEVRSLPPPPEEAVPAVKEAPAGPDHDVSMDMSTSVKPEPEPVKPEPEPEPLLPPEINYGEEFTMDDFNADFVNSQPMNLADLDSAMEFGWD